MSDIRDAVLIAYEKADDIFSGEDIIQWVRNYVERPKLYQDTILWHLRKLRQTGIIKYTCEVKKLSVYEKQDGGEEGEVLYKEAT